MKRYTVSEETYNKVFNACMGMCVLCSTTQNLHLHHICGRGRYLTDEPTNCVMLCRTCHEMVHADLKKYRPILLEIASKIYNVNIYAGARGGDTITDLYNVLEKIEKNTKEN